MNLGKKQEIKDAVRQRYAAIANNDRAAGAKKRILCCSPAKMSGEVKSSLSCSALPQDDNVEQISTIMGYSSKNLRDIPEGTNMGLGCGNPVALASLRPGETVVDLGSGGGFDCFLAAKAVGASGKVIGVDMTPDMVSKARMNAEKLAAKNVEFRLGEIENLPVASNSADVVMSNCVINLSPDKQAVYHEVFRVLKPDGRLAISDVLTNAELPESVKNDLALIGACIGGAATIEATKELLEKAGFEDIRIDLHEFSRELINEWAPGKSEKDAEHVFSSYIQACKPATPR